MPTTVQQIDLWRQARSEHQRLEFKEAKTQFDSRRLQDYCVAIANEGGGFLVLGVADKPPRPVVVSRGETGGHFRGDRGPNRARRNRGGLGAILEFDPVWYLTT